MKKAIVIGFLGFVIAFLSMFVPIIGIPSFILGIAMMLWSVILFWGAIFGAGARAARRAAGDKTGTGKL